MSIKYGDTVIYIGIHNPNFINGNSYIIEHVIDDENIENFHIYYYLKGIDFEVCDSLYFMSLKEYRKLKLQLLEQYDI